MNEIGYFEGLETQAKQMSVAAVSRVNLGGWPVVRLGREEFARLMLDDCRLVRSSIPKPSPRLVFDANGQALSLAQTDPFYRRAMRAADFIHADGQSLVFASWWLSPAALPERIATTDFFHDAAQLAQQEGLRFYLLGASEEMNRLAAEKAQRCYPDLQLVGRRNGYFGESEEEDICREIVASRADVLWVGLGKPKEQLFCVRNRERLSGVGWLKTCGGLFDFLGGRNKRAPQWMQDAGLEWLHRLALDPRRFFWRYLTTNIHATYLLLARSGKR